jgi:ABC-type glycerol-3-phosphate transport system substrate-binding protein
MNSIDLYPGIDLFNTEKGAMTQVVGPLVPQTLSTLGTEKVGLMVFPVFGEGKMAGRPIADAQGLGISSQSANKEGAAKFLEFLHTDERVQALWKQVHQLPADSTWDGSVVSDPVIKEIWQRWMHGDNVAYISNLMPTLFWNDAMFVNSQKIVSGDFTGEQAGEKAESIAEKWRKENPDFVKRYNKWINDLTL